MKKRISISDISKIFTNALNKSKLKEEDSSVIFYDLDFLLARINSLKELFPKDTIHAIAAKANPLIKILHKFKQAGVGLETASLPELYIAEKVGFNPNTIIFDSPSKTREEIKYALKLGVHLNADSFSELKRIDTLYIPSHTKSNIGVRINPQVGSGTIKTTSVADKISKFGIPIDEHRQKIVDAYIKYKWLNSIHLHIGSQGISIQQLLHGLKKVYELSEEINQQLKSHGRKIEYFDMGGGFPVSYKFDDKTPQLDTYIKQVKENHPKLFSGDYKLLTEFGRYISANSAWAISRVEYVKEEPNFKILSTHLGADFLLRTAYNPKDWQHEITVVDKNGNLKKGLDKKKYIVAGPLCFAGDIITTDIELPVIEEGDFLVIHDIGAYTLSMWSRYNSRQMPKIFGYSIDSNGSSYEVLKKREKLDSIYDFWN